MNDFLMYPVHTKNMGEASGCFDLENTVGQMHLSSFTISIKSLVTDFSYFRSMKLDQWVEVCGFMKKHLMTNQDSPK